MYRICKKGNFLKFDLSDAAMLFLVSYLSNFTLKFTPSSECGLKELAGEGEGRKGYSRWDGKEILQQSPYFP